MLQALETREGCYRKRPHAPDTSMSPRTVTRWQPHGAGMCVCVCDTWAKEQLPKHAEIILNNFEACIVSSKGCIYPKESPFKHDHSPVFESIARARGNLMTPWLWQHISKPRETAFSFFPTNKSPCRKLNSPRPSAYIFTLRVGSWRAVATEGLRDWSQPEAQSHLPVPLIAPQVLTAAFDTSQCSGAHSTLSG